MMENVLKHSKPSTTVKANIDGWIIAQTEVLMILKNLKLRCWLNTFEMHLG